MINILKNMISLFNNIKKFKYDKNLREKILLFLVFFILSIIVSYPVLTNKFLLGHDTKFFIGVIDGLRDNILDWHQLPYRINYDYSMGNLQPIFYHNILLYPTAIMQLLFNTKVEFDFSVLFNPASINITYFLIHLFSGINMYIASNSIFKNKRIAFASALFYMFTYVRLKYSYYNGMLGMILSFIIIPIYILSLYEIFFRNEKKWYLFVISATLIFHSHMISTYLYAIFSVLLFIFFIFSNFSKHRLFVFIKSLIVTLCINLFIIWPILDCIFTMDIMNPAEMYHGTIISSSLADSINLNHFFEILPPIKSRYFSPGIFLLIAIIVIIIFLIYRFFNKFVLNKSNPNICKCDDVDNNSNLNNFIVYLSILTIVFMILVFNFYSINNNILYVLFSILQFRMRFYMLVIPLAAICFPYILYLLFNKLLFKFIKLKNFLFIMFFLLISLLTGIYIVADVKKNATYVDEIIGIYNLDYALRDSLIDFNSPVFFPNDLIETSDKSINIVSLNFSNRTNVDFEYELKNTDNQSNNKDLYVDIALFDYPVYRARDEKNNPIKISHGDHGRIRFYLNEKSGKIYIKQIEPLSWLIFDLISLFSFIIFIYYIIKKRNNKIVNKKRTAQH